MSKIAIVGVEGSGKTVLMAALGDRFGQPSDENLYLMPENQAAYTFMTQIPHKMREEHQWPAATAIDSMKLLKWTLRIGQRIISEIEMLDYPGELYRLAFGERSEEEIEPHREQIHEFLDHLVNADTVVVLYNLGDAMNIGADAKKTETMWLTRCIFEYIKKLPNVKQRLLLFTQADRYYNELNSCGDIAKAKAQYLPMIHQLNPDLECASIAVSTDQIDTPAQEFAMSHDVMNFMRWIVSHSKEGTAVNRYVEKCTAWLQEVAQGGTNAESGNKLLSEWDSMQHGVAHIVAPQEAQTLQSMLQSGIESARVAHKKAEVDARKKAEEQQRQADIENAKIAINWCAEFQERTKDINSLQRLKEKIDEFETSLVNARQHENLLDEATQNSLHEQEKYYDRLRSLATSIETLVKSNGAFKLGKKEMWLPVSMRFPEPELAKIIESISTTYKEERRSIYLFFAVLAVIIVILLSVIGYNLLIAQPRYRAEKEKERKHNVALANQSAKVLKERDAQKLVAFGDWNQDLGSNVFMDFVCVEPGNFAMGSKNGYESEKPVHVVTISQPFWIGKYEVTQEQYREITGSNPSYFENADNPVEEVSWQSATDFCTILTERARYAGLLPYGYEYRLPTEAEWEYAARGGVQSKGYTYSGSDNAKDVAVFSSKPQPVGSKKCNELGLYDMSGNVYEWCFDWYNRDYYKQTKDASDPVNLSTGSSRVVRGGGWYYGASGCRVALRDSNDPSSTIHNLGFRVALAPALQ